MSENEEGIGKAAYTVQQFCRCYGICRSSFYEELKAGRLRARKAGGRTLVLADDARAWAQSLPEMRAS